MATDAEKVKMYREKAKDESIPQEVRNTYLDRANELERKAYEATKGTPPAKLAKGGMPVRGSRTATNKEKKMMGGGYAMPTKTPMMAKGGAASKKPVLAIMIGVGKPSAKDAPKGGTAKYMEFSNKGKPKGMAPVKAMNKGGMAKKGKC
jgi:hypothetical protein